jgi:hypothetical protein
MQIAIRIQFREVEDVNFTGFSLQRFLSELAESKDLRHFARHVKPFRNDALIISTRDAPALSWCLTWAALIRLLPPCATRLIVRNQDRGSRPPSFRSWEICARPNKLPMRLPESRKRLIFDPECGVVKARHEALAKYFASQFFGDLSFSDFDYVVAGGLFRIWAP